MGVNWPTVQVVYEWLLAPFLRLGEWIEDRRCAQAWRQVSPDPSLWGAIQPRDINVLARFTENIPTFQAIDIPSLRSMGQHYEWSPPFDQGWEACDVLLEPGHIYDGDNVRLNTHCWRWEKRIGYVVPQSAERATTNGHH